MQSQTIYYHIKTVSPVHIGCDEVYEPTGFVVDEKEKQLVSFDPSEFIGMLDSDALDQFSNICKKGTPQSLVEIYRFMNRHKNLAKGQRVAVSDAFVEHYQKTLKLTGEKNVLRNLNKYQVKRTAFNPHIDTAYIPGSTIKGSIRTAVLNFRNKGRTFPKYKFNEAKKLEQNLTGGSFEKDPFRLVKVSDFIAVGEVKRRIVYAVNRKKKPSKFEAGGPAQILEIVEPNVDFFGSITITEVPRNGKIHHPVTKKEISSALTHFFGNEKQREDRQLSGISIPSVQFSFSAARLPLRIGFHSGAECVTIEGHRRIKIMQGKGNKPKYENHATTFWLAAHSKKPAANEHLQPFGWVVFEKLSAEEVSQLQQQITREREIRLARQQELMTQQQKEANERKSILLVRKKEEKRKQDEADAARKKERANKEKWQAMTEDERDLAILAGTELAKTNVPDLDILQNIWPKIDSAEPDQQKALAKGFMKLWQSEGKWKVKKKKKKQFAKVQKVKEILGLS